ncbi:MAG: single-stranded DNA-binding protein [Chitinophagales bacterium]
MNKLRNHVQLIGRLGTDLELKQLDNGKAFTSISIATNDFYKDKDGNSVQNTEWHRAVAWGKTAENFCKICKKGDEVALEGKLSHRKFDTPDGETKYITEVVVNEFALMNSKEVK